jgi:hypothetical protein
MKKAVSFVPRAAIFLAGAAIGAVVLKRKEAPGDPAAAAELKKALSNLEAKVAEQGTATGERFTHIEARLEEHAAKLAEVPSTSQIVAAMEQLLSKTMASLDDRLTTQAHSIEVLKTTVSQTDSLLERVLESLDSLQTFTDPSDLSQDILLQRPV